MQLSNRFLMKLTSDNNSMILIIIARRRINNPELFHLKFIVKSVAANESFVTKTWEFYFRHSLERHRAVKNEPPEVPVDFFAPDLNLSQTGSFIIRARVLVTVGEQSENLSGH